MRVLFVQAISTESINAEMVYPIGIVTLATRIKEEHEVEILDLNIEEDPFGELKKTIIHMKPQVVCISLRNIDLLGNKMTSLIPQFTVAVKMISQLLPEVVIIAGGTGFSLFPKEIMNLLTEIKYGIIGEGEDTLPTLLGSLTEPLFLKGLCFRDNDQIVVIDSSKEIDMESSYVNPDRSLLDPSLYERNSYVQSLGIETKRGCPFNCSYCVYPNLQGRKLRCRSPKEVVYEIEMINKKYGIDRIHFTDPVVNIPSGHLENICELLIKNKVKVKWSGFFREDFLNDYNTELFAKSGCECFSFSPDGLCQESLDTLGKNLKVSDIINAAKLTSKTDVISVYHFMVNVPGENSKTLKEGTELIERIYSIHKDNRNLGTIVLNNIRIYPDTPIYNYAIKNGIITPSTELLYPTYYNPEPYKSLRYQLETKHLCKNIFMWQEVDYEDIVIRTP
ncbi:MAG: B12 lower ligand biosynthesis radical SAM protein BzaD [Eubacteriaceae bacterium]